MGTYKLKMGVKALKEIAHNSQRSASLAKKDAILDELEELRKQITVCDINTEFVDILDRRIEMCKREIDYLGSFFE